MNLINFNFESINLDYFFFFFNKNVVYKYNVSDKKKNGIDRFAKSSITLPQTFNNKEGFFFFFSHT